MESILNTASFKDLPVLVFKVKQEDFSIKPFDPETEKIDDTYRCLLFLEGEKEKPERWVFLFGEVRVHMALQYIRYGSMVEGGEVWTEVCPEKKLDLPFFYCFGGGTISDEGIGGRSFGFGALKDPVAIGAINHVFKFEG